MKEKILEFLIKLSKFSLLEFLLMRNIEKNLKSIDLKNGLINYHKSLIKDAEDQIADSIQVIADLESDMLEIKKKIKDIENV